MKQEALREEVQGASNQDGGLVEEAGGKEAGERGR